MLSPALRVVTFTALPAAAVLTLALLYGGAPASSAPAPAALTPQAPAQPVATAAGAGLTAEVTVDRETVWVEDGELHVALQLTGDAASADAAAAPRTPTDVVVVLDRSGSMSGEKIAQARQAAMQLLGQLSEEDRFTLVTYASDAQVTIPLGPVRPGAQGTLADTILSIEAAGSTNMQTGLDRGLGQLAESAPGRARRIILLSDGLPDTPEGLVDRAHAAARQEIPLSAVGIGDDYDEQLMTRLADAGTGSFYWASGDEDLGAVFAGELRTAQETVAAALEVELRSPAAAALTEAAGYPIAAQRSFKMGSVYASQERRLWLTVAMPTGQLGEVDPGDLQLSWRDAAGRPRSVTLDLPPVEVTADRDDFLAGLDAAAWEQAVLEEEYNCMRAEVSAKVQAGDREGALQLIDSYALDNEAINYAVGSAAVEGNLAEVQQMRAEVESTFTGADQDSRRNYWSKSTNASAYSGRKIGRPAAAIDPSGQVTTSLFSAPARRPL